MMKPSDASPEIYRILRGDRYFINASQHNRDGKTTFIPT
jgi:hypothetical protein